MKKVKEPYSQFHFVDVFLQALGSTIGDRVVTNHCVTLEIEEFLCKKLYELNCNLHPLDGLAVGCRKALSVHDKEKDIPSAVYGYDCRAANLIFAVSKMRFE